MKTGLSKDKLIGKMLKNGKPTFKLNNDTIDLTNPTYDVYINNEVLFNVKLNGEKKSTKLAILTVQEWKVESIKLTKKTGNYKCNIEVPNTHSVYINGSLLSQDNNTNAQIDDGTKEISNYTDISYLITYKIDGLFNEPEIKIQDKEGKNIDFNKDGDSIKVALNLQEVTDKTEALSKIKGDIDIEQIAKDWSLYLSDDLKGSQHGFSSISKYLIKDSKLWKFAYKWATGEDITFVSNHRLENPAFTNLKLENFKFYNENAFSCEIYLEKNMIIGSGKKLQDVLNERMYFVYYENEWKLVGMQSITNNK